MCKKGERGDDLEGNYADTKHSLISSGIGRVTRPRNADYRDQLNAGDAGIEDLPWSYASPPHHGIAPSSYHEPFSLRASLCVLCASTWNRMGLTWDITSEHDPREIRRRGCQKN